MGRRKMQEGICRLCKKKTKISFEHIPPKVAFNKHTKYRTIPFIEYVKNIDNPNYKPTGKLMQGGLGKYCLCQTCNSFLGQKYVPSYYRMAFVGKYVLQIYNAERVHFSMKLSPLKFLKQVLSMFISINEPWFTDEHNELLTFVKNPEKQNLNQRYRIYMYLNNTGNTRSIPWIYTNTYGLISEITFPPLGLVLSVDNSETIPQLAEITHFKNIDLNYDDTVNFKLNILPTHLPYPLDYRTQEEINKL